MTPITLSSVAVKTAAAIAAVAGLAFAAVDGPDAYGDARLRSLTEADVAGHAARVFARADMDQSGALDADEYTALSVITAELARLNGFIVIEREDAPGVIELSAAEPAALPEAEQIRIAAVSRNAFYVFAGLDGEMTREEFAAAQGSLFASADLNGNGKLARRELALFAQRQANFTSGV